MVGGVPIPRGGGGQGGQGGPGVPVPLPPRSINRPGSTVSNMSSNGGEGFGGPTGGGRHERERERERARVAPQKRQGMF